MQNRSDNICSPLESHFNDTRPLQNDTNLYNSPLTLRDLLRNFTVSATKVSQDAILPEGHPGACTGLSTIHIIQQLNSDELIPNNPFEDNNHLKQAIALHETCQSRTLCMIRHGIKNTLTEQDKIIKKSRSTNLISALEKSDPNELEQKLLKEVNDTHDDELGRKLQDANLSIKSRAPRIKKHSSTKKNEHE